MILILRLLKKGGGSQETIVVSGICSLITRIIGSPMKCTK